VDPVTLYNFLATQPFQPVRVYLRDGRTYDIRFRQLAIVGVTWLDIGLPAPGEPPGPLSHWSFLERNFGYSWPRACSSLCTGNFVWFKLCIAWQRPLLVEVKSGHGESSTSITRCPDSRNRPRRNAAKDSTRPKLSGRSTICRRSALSKRASVSAAVAST
jgi:hypothetical protein